MKPADDQTTKGPRPKSEIELSTVYWYDTALPASVPLLDSTLKVPGAKTGFHALYGHRGRQEGFMAARNRAVETGMAYTVIDMKLRLGMPLSQEKRNESNMRDQEIFPVHLLTSAYARELDYRIRSDMHLRRTPDEDHSANVLLETLAKHPQAAAMLLSYPEFDHIKVLVHLAKTSFSNELLPVATIPERYLGAIVEAKCRLDPDVAIRLPSADQNLELVTTGQAPAARVTTARAAKP